VRLAPVAAGAWAVAGLSTVAPATSTWLAIGSWVAALAMLAWLVRAPRRRRHMADASLWAVVAVLALVAGAAAASHVAFALPARGDAASLGLDGGRAVTVAAVVTGKVERRSDGRVAFDAVALRVSAGPEPQAVSTDVTIRVDPSDVSGVAPVDVGARIVASGTVRDASPGDRAVLVVTARELDVVEGPVGVAAAGGQLRRGLVSAARGLPAPGSELVPGLAVGDTSLVSPELDAAMKSSSLSHLTAVSGANCALVVGIAFGIAALCGAPRGIRVGVALAALGGFIVLVTPEPSVVRAGVMAALAMLGVALGRSGHGFSLLCLAVAVLVVADPWLSTSLGFALSAAATGSLLLFARPLAKGLSRWMPRAPALALSVPLAAQLACGPLLVMIAPSVPLYGVVANLLAAPAAAPATIVGLLACLAAPVPVLAYGMAAIAWVPGAWIAGTAMTFAALPGGQLPWLEGLPGLVVLAVLGTAVGLLIGLSSRARRARAVAGAIVAVTVGAAAGTSALAGVAGRWTIPSSWSIIACDIGQGDALVLRSADAVALVDTGPDPAALGTCLAKAGVDRIDLLVLTHFDLDHAGGVDAVIDRVETVLHGPPASASDEGLLARLDAAGSRVVEASAGMAGSLGEARWRVLWPRADNRAFPTGNDASVVLDVRGGGIPPSLLLGDLSASPQRSLVASGTLAPPYALVKVAHHGSADQEPRIYELAHPSVAVMMVGADNTFGHPRAETIAVLEGLGTKVGRTDRDGLVAVWEDGGRLILWRERGTEPDARPGRPRGPPAAADVGVGGRCEYGRMTEDPRSLWDAEAETFDESADHGLRDPDIRRAWADLLLPVIDGRGLRVADLGCGTGTLSLLLAQEGGHLVTGVDFSPEMIRRAREKGAQTHPRPDFVVADAADPPLPAGSFDVVLSRHVLWAMPDPAAALENWIKLLTPTGVLILVEGRWHTGAGLTAEESVRIVSDRRQSVQLRALDDPSYWGGAISDERYLIVSPS